MTRTFDFMKGFLTDRRIKYNSAHTDRDGPVPVSVYDQKRCFQTFDLLVVFKGFYEQYCGELQYHGGRQVARTA